MLPYSEVARREVMLIEIHPQAAAESQAAAAWLKRKHAGRLTAVSIVFGLMLLACGDGSEPSSLQEQALRSWEAGDIDPFGCPFVRPIPWVSVAEHQTTCGPGCQPEGVDETFVGCVSSDVPPYPHEVVSAMRICLTHPVDGEDYRFANLASAWPFMHSCWRLCGAASIHPSDDFQPPAECFEE